MSREQQLALDAFVAYAATVKNLLDLQRTRDFPHARLIITDLMIIPARAFVDLGKDLNVDLSGLLHDLRNY